MNTTILVGSMVSRRFAGVAALLLCAAAATIGTSAQQPSGRASTYAISGARIVTLAGPVIESGTLVVRGNQISSIASGAEVPVGSVVLEGRGLTVYPGFIDMGTTVGLTSAGPGEQPADLTREAAERWKRTALLRPQLDVAQILDPRPDALRTLAAAGITSALLIPPGQLVRGRSALVNVADADEAVLPGHVLSAMDERALVVNPSVALHVALPLRIAGEAYPASLIGALALLRQTLLDAQRFQKARALGLPWTESTPDDVVLEALVPALEGRIPVAIEANEAREIHSALSFAREFGFRPIITGGRQADETLPELKAAGAPVLLDLDYPTRPRSLAPDADESLRVLEARAAAPLVAAKLRKAGVPFAFRFDRLERPGDFLANAAKAVAAGLDADACLRGLTIEAARLAGVADRMGSLEVGKIANLVLLEGEIFSPRAAIRHVFVDGAPVTLPSAPPRAPRR